ncbi:MAG TPA: cation:proton antiporter [Chryseolinea sp.]|nr:cation:proton antiporter [Chryseolinea sp.]
MKRAATNTFYVVVIGAFSGLIYWILYQGSKLEHGRSIALPDSDKTSWHEFTNSIGNNLTHPLATLLIQILTIIVVARIFGWICKKLGQPTVVGEMIAGIVLGPSLLGLYFPEFSAVLFPKASLPNLQFLSQIGLILFMFIVGMELDLKVLRNKAHEAVVVSHASIIVPFALGIGLAYFIYENFSPENIQFSSFSLFLGIAMSITAFPVLARIVQERGIAKTRLGTIVITCAAADDITAWSLLAAVIAIVKAGSFVSGMYVILFAVIYVFLMIKIVRPFLKRIGDLHSSAENLSKPIVAIFFLILILSAFTTEMLGIHALFGAFMAGAIMPENIRFRNIFIEKVEDVSVVLLLPLFFVFTGLRTQIGLLNDPYLWKITGLIIVVAVSGKFLGSAIAAKFVGQSWKDSLTIGALMNTRGLMELVVLNIGYDLGVLSPQIFAMMVLMALVTTFMTGPALDLINRFFKTGKEVVATNTVENSKFRILISFGNPQRGKSLLRLANGMVKKLNGNAAVTAMHLSPSGELHSYNMEAYETESFAPIIQESHRLNQKLQTLFKGSNDIDADIAEVANKGAYDILLIGVGQSIFEGSLLGRILGFTTRFINPDRLISQVKGKEKLFESFHVDARTRQILLKAHVPVGVFIDKGFNSLDSVFIPLFSERDSLLLNYAQKLINNAGAHVTLFDAAGQIKNQVHLKESIRAIEQIAPNHVRLISGTKIDEESLAGHHLMLLTMESWKKLLDAKSLWLSHIPSTLIIAEK